MADATISSLPLGTPSGSLFVPISDSTSTYKAPLSDIQVNYNSLVNKPSIPQGIPIGAVFHLATSTVPAGYLKCNGDTVPNGNGTVQGVTADFSALYATLGSTYGSAGKVPDLRSEFIRGFDDGRGIDSGRVFGSNQAQDWKGFYMTNTGVNTYSYSHFDVYMGKSTTNYIGNLFTGGWNDPSSATGTKWDNSEIRPRNVALMPVIKY
jgi:phage-related tail fiber protein